MMGKQSVAGIVVKVTEANIVLLCQDGTFQNVARPTRDAPPLIGERYSQIKKKTSWLKYTSVAAIFLLTFISYLLLPSGQGDSAYVVAIDINPSIELTVNEALEVIETSANNPDGETLLTTIAMQGDQLAVAIEKITTYSEASGFFLEGKYLTTSVIPFKDQKIELIEKIEKIIEKSINKPDLDVVMLQNSKANYDQAKKSNLSVNQYAYYKELENSGAVKTIEEVKGKSMAELRKMQNADKAPGRNKPEKENNSNKPDNAGPDHKETDKNPSSNKPEEKKSGKPDSVGQAQEKTEKAGQPAQAQAKKNSEHAEIRKSVQKERRKQDQGKDNNSNRDAPPNKLESNQKEPPKANK